MKKFILSIVAAALALTASAQVYVGGELGFWRDYDNNQTTFKILPEAGYNLSDKLAIGMVIGYEHDYYKKVSVNSFVVNPYARYTYAKLGPVNLFLDGGFGFLTSKVKDADDSSNAWEVGVKPGLSVNLTEKLSFVTHFGFLGWRTADDGLKDIVDEGFGFDVQGNSLTFGLYYNF